MHSDTVQHVIKLAQQLQTYAGLVWSQKRWSTTTSDWSSYIYMNILPTDKCRVFKLYQSAFHGIESRTQLQLTINFKTWHVHHIMTTWMLMRMQGCEDEDTTLVGAWYTLLQIQRNMTQILSVLSARLNWDSAGFPSRVNRKLCHHLWCSNFATPLSVQCNPISRPQAYSQLGIMMHDFPHHWYVFLSIK